MNAPAVSSDVPADVLAWWQAAQRPCVLSGAGMSAESGVPTFRDTPKSLWARFNPETLATAEAFERDPALVWAWYIDVVALNPERDTTLRAGAVPVTVKQPLAA